MAVLWAAAEHGVKVKVSPILVGRVLGNTADPVLGSHPADGSMHSHEPVGGLPPPSTRPKATQMHIIKRAIGCHYFLPGLQLPSQPSGITALRPVPTYTAWSQRHISVRNLARVCMLCSQPKLKPTTSWSQVQRSTESATMPPNT